MPRELAVSNLAWIGHDDAPYLDLLVSEGVTALEVAPSLLFDGDPTAATAQRRSDVRATIEAAGLRVAAAQSLYFAQPDLRLFGADADRNRFVEYSKRVADVCADLGAATLSFGAPNQRSRGNLAIDVAIERGAGVFHDIGEHALDLGLRYAVEALPGAVGADFLESLAEVSDLVVRADSPGVGILVDTGTTDPADGLPIRGAVVVHVQVSRLLEPVVRTRRQEDWAGLLGDYDGVVSIEMKPAFPDDLDENLGAVRAAIRDVASLYL